MLIFTNTDLLTVMLELLTGQSGSNKEGISLPYREPMKLFKALGVQRPQFACEAARILYNNDQVGHWIKEEASIYLFLKHAKIR